MLHVHTTTRYCFVFLLAEAEMRTSVQNMTLGSHSLH